VRRLLPVLVLSLTLACAACSAEPEASRDAEGVVASPGAIDAFEVALGDCVNEPAEFSSEEVAEVESLTGVPCGQPHDGEVFLLTDLPDGDFPGDETVIDTADKLCGAEFEPFIGLPYDDSVYDFATLFPSAETWTTGDREIVCIAFAPEGETVTGSLKNIKG